MKKQSFIQKSLLTYAPAIGLIFMLASYFPQLWMTYTTQNVQGQSLSFWILLSVGLIAMTGQQVGMIRYGGVKAYMGLVFQALNTVLALAMLVGVLIFS